MLRVTSYCLLLVGWLAIKNTQAQAWRIPSGPIVESEHVVQTSGLYKLQGCICDGGIVKDRYTDGPSQPNQQQAIAIDHERQHNTHPETEPSPLCACDGVGPPLAVAQDVQTEGGDDELVSSKSLQDLINLKSLVEGSQQLQDFAYAYPERNRVFGGQAHNDTIQWIHDTLQKTGFYDVEVQQFIELFSGGNATLALAGKDTPVGLFTYTPRGYVMAPVVAVSNLGCEATDFPFGVQGNVALISRGSCPFGQKAAIAKAAGAAGAIIYDNINSTGPLAGTLGGAGDYAPVVGITRAKGQALLAALASGPVFANLQVNSILENRTTFNVIAETKSGDHDNVLTLGAHTDSVEAGPGINDDGSGTVGLLTVAQALSNFQINNAIRFCFWSAEEYGLLGSEHYVRTLNSSSSTGKSELDKIRAYLNFDMIASPNYVYAIYDGSGHAFNRSGPPGSAQIQRNFETFYESQGQAHVPTEFDGRSDYGPFLDVGIASGGTFTGAEEIKTEEEARLFGGQAGVADDVNYHAKGDDMTNLNLEAYLLNTKCIADAVATYALSLEGLGPEAGVADREYGPWMVNREKRVAGIQRRVRGLYGHKFPVSL